MISFLQCIIFEQISYSEFILGRNFILRSRKRYKPVLGQWDILLLNFGSIGFMNFFICLMLNCYISIYKKEKLKDETSKKSWNAWKSIGLASFHEFSLDVSSLIVTTSEFVKKEMSKMRHLKKFLKPMEVKLRSNMSHWPKIPHRYGYYC